jgi:transcriptional regulator with XRE-family HTH domain
MNAGSSRRRKSGVGFASRDHDARLSTDANAADGADARRRGERIRIAIQQRGVKKLTALAAEIGVTEGALTRWRQGGPMSLDNGIRFCQVLDVSLDWLAMGRAHPDHHRQQTFNQDRQRLLTALDALPPGAEAHLARLFEHLASGGDPFGPR